MNTIAIDTRSATADAVLVARLFRNAPNSAPGDLTDSLFGNLPEQVAELLISIFSRRPGFKQGQVLSGLPVEMIVYEMPCDVSVSKTAFYEKHNTEQKAYGERCLKPTEPFTFHDHSSH